MKKKSKKREVDATKFWVFLVCGFIIGAALGTFVSQGITGNILHKWTDDWKIESTTTTCTDSDNNFNLESRGVCNDGSGIKIDKCMMVGEKRVLFEYSCVDNKCVEQKVYCEDYGYFGTSAYASCYLGACHSK